jgi:hypothetical protein
MHYVPHLDENYDRDNNVVFYRLHDRLCPDAEKASPEHALRRGLTGWVAVTGQYLKINNERAQSLLEDLEKERPDIRHHRTLYGRPVWGRRTTEVADKSAADWSKRYLAVPILLNNHTQQVIGVLRYTCELNGPELTDIDRTILENLATIISAVLSLDRIKAVTSRAERLKLEIPHLRTSGDLNQFLKFLSTSTRSKIASLYVWLPINGRSVLRVLDAYGLSGTVADLRDQLADDEEITSGLTWQIFRDHLSDPIAMESVAESKNWRGLNSSVFYGEHFRQLGLKNIMEDLARGRQSTLEHHPIKLMGMSLGTQERPLGVVRVEFPTTFDSEAHYGAADLDFLKQCGDTLLTELEDVQSFISGRWFAGAGREAAGEFRRLFLLVERTRLVRRNEAEAYWTNIEEYWRRYGEDVLREAKTTRADLSAGDRVRLEHLRESLLSRAASGVVDRILLHQLSTEDAGASEKEEATGSQDRERFPTLVRREAALGFMSILLGPIALIISTIWSSEAFVFATSAGCSLGALLLFHALSRARNHLKS